MFKGELGLISMPNLIQLLSHEKKTGAICISNGGREIGNIFFNDGDIIAAESEGLRGKEALFRLINLKKGEFLFKEDVKLPPVEIRESCEVLLLEALKYEDESKELEEKLLAEFKDQVSKVGKVDLKELWDYVSKVSDLLDLGKLEYVWIKDKSSSLVFQVMEETFKFDLVSGARGEEVGENIMDFLRGEGYASS